MKKENITISDKFLAVTFLRLFPSFIVPNHLTLARFFATPFVLYFVFLEDYVIGITLFSLAAFTDALDGAMARTRNQVTEWGKTFDPLADKLLIGLTALIVIPKYLDFQLIFLILVIEALFIVSAYYIKQREGEIQANGWGKTKMIFQSFGIGFILLFALINIPLLLVIANVLLYVSILFAVISLVSHGI